MGSFSVEGITTKTKLEHVQVLVSSIYRQLRFHLDSGLECINPPVATTHYLLRQGFSQRLVKNFWRNYSRTVSIPLFKRRSVRVEILLKHWKGVVHHDAETGVPVDDLNCRRINCMVSTNTHALYGQILVETSGSLVRLSFLRLLCLLEHTQRGSAFTLLGMVRDAAAGRYDRLASLVEYVAEMLTRFRGLVKAIDPQLPGSLIEALEGSAILRELVYRASTATIRATKRL